MDDIQRMLNIMDAEMKKRRIKKGDIATLFGVSRATVSNMFNRKYKIEYMRFIQLTRIVFGQYHHDFIRRFCRAAKTKVEIEAMEWAYANGDTEVLELLIHNAKEESKPTEKEKNKSTDQEEDEHITITDIYELQYERLVGKVNIEEFFARTEDMMMDFKGMDLEKHVMLKISCMYADIYDRSYRSVWSKGKNLLKHLNKIENDYLRKAYEMRIKIILLYIGTRARKYEECEKMANEMINNKEVLEHFPVYHTHALICLSEIYALDNFEKSSHYIKQAVEMMDKGYFDSNEGWKVNIKSTYDFVHIHHKKFEGLYLQAEDERAHYLAKGNEEERKEAVRILNTLQERDGEICEFVMYYKALALNDKSLMERAKDMFHDAGDFHYSRLAVDFIEDSQ
ncbi:MAG: hypothetical protein K0S80_4496 [Neobacillus sp.]|nr:hypothetical protein [Neobacillus sp.]